ncbi:MAG: TetR/AcrR family transcriptional regulator [Actinomycetota bacterium]
MVTKTEKKERSRRRILDSSARRIRERGISGTSVAEVMDGAGMTVGGFYAHFPSKDALVAETVTEAMCQARANLCAAAGDSRGAEWLRAAARSYLSRAHRDNPSLGCPLPATAGEIARADVPVRRALAAGIEEVAGEIATHEREAGRDESRAEALAALAMMVGGLTLARAIEGTPLSDELLKACRDHIDRCLGDK